jgi:hypothetical protein
MRVKSSKTLTDRPQHRCAFGPHPSQRRMGAFFLRRLNTEEGRAMTGGCRCDRSEWLPPTHLARKQLGRLGRGTGRQAAREGPGRQPLGVKRQSSATGVMKVLHEPRFRLTQSLSFLKSNFPWQNLLEFVGASRGVMLQFARTARTENSVWSCPL